VSTGIVCEGAERGLGENCNGVAPPETGLCTGCCAQARELNIEIPVRSHREMVERAWPKREPFSSGKHEPELELG
jgi:hypothetical protein